MATPLREYNSFPHNSYGNNGDMAVYRAKKGAMRGEMYQCLKHAGRWYTTGEQLMDIATSSLRFPMTMQEETYWQSADYKTGESVLIGNPQINGLDSDWGFNVNPIDITYDNVLAFWATPSGQTPKNMKMIFGNTGGQATDVYGIRAEDSQFVISNDGDWDVSSDARGFYTAFYSTVGYTNGIPSTTAFDYADAGVSLNAIYGLQTTIYTDISNTEAIGANLAVRVDSGYSIGLEIDSRGGRAAGIMLLAESGAPGVDTKGINILVKSTGTTGVTAGIYIDSIESTGIANDACGIYIGNGVVAGHGSSTAFPIYSAAIQASYFAGPIGIGTATPEATLELQSSAPVLRLRDTGATADATLAYIEFGGTDAGVWKRTGYVGDASTGNTEIHLQAEEGDLHLGDSSGFSVLNLKDGDVGIGIAVPTQKLHVVGNIAAVNPGDDAYLYLGEGSAAGTYGWLKWESTGDLLVLGTQTGGDDFFLTEAGHVYLANAAGPQLQNELSSLTNPTLLPNRNQANNGVGASSTAVALITDGVPKAYISSAGDSVGNTQFFIRAQTAATPTYGTTRVLVGADDSAGAGFRTLRIVNL